MSGFYSYSLWKKKLSIGTVRTWVSIALIISVSLALRSYLIQQMDQTEKQEIQEQKQKIKQKIKEKKRTWNSLSYRIYNPLAFLENLEKEESLKKSKPEMKSEIKSERNVKLKPPNIEKPKNPKTDDLKASQKEVSKKKQSKKTPSQNEIIREKILKSERDLREPSDIFFP